MKNSDATLVLNVDDDKDSRKLIERFLAGAGYCVLSADSGASALSLVSEATPDLILLDVIMPGMDGYAVCAELLQPTTASMRSCSWAVNSKRVTDSLTGDKGG